MAGVIAADGVLCDLTTKLAQGLLPVVCLLGAGDDPHSFVLTPQQRAAWARARLRLVNGYNLTPALHQLPKAVRVAEIAVPTSIWMGSGRDPHVWHNPANAAAMTRVIAKQLAPLLPAGDQGRLEQRSMAMVGLLHQLQLWQAAQLASIPTGPGGNSSPLATSHRSMASFAELHGLRELPLVDSFSDSDSLRPQQLQKVVGRLKREQVLRLFAEPGPPGRDLERISSLSGVPIAQTPLWTDGLGKNAEGQGLNLVATSVQNTCAISLGLGGKCDRIAGERLGRQWGR